MITERLVYQSLSLPAASSGDRVNIIFHDADRRIVLGVDESRRLTLVVGDVGESQHVHGQIAELMADQTVTLEPSGILITGAAILYCRTQELSQEEMAAFASLLVAICHLRSSPQEPILTAALVGLANLLNRRALRAGNVSTTIGLMGELLILLSSRDPNFHFTCWRSDPHSDFDFSSEDSRLEVKTTTQAIRQHEFSSTQFISSSSTVFVASVRLLRVEAGSNLSQMVEDLSKRLDSRYRNALTDRVNATLGCPYMLANQPLVDVRNSMNLIRIWPQASIPRVLLSQGILWARWGALLPEEQPDIAATSPLVSLLGL